MLSTVLAATNAAFAFGTGAATTISRKSSPSSPPPLLPLHYGDGTTILSAKTQKLGATTSDTTTTPTTTTSWKGQLLRVSNLASLLCIVDCTVLPMVTVVLPWFGWVAASPAQMELMHRLGHQIALYFVLPVGGSATLLHYLYAHQQQRRIAALGLFGLFLVAAANAPHNGTQQSLWRILLLLTVPHQGWMHRLVNSLGCACLVGSNYWSRQSTGKCCHAHDSSDCCSDSGHIYGNQDHHHDH